jgi:hypothetical protein
MWDTWVSTVRRESSNWSAMSDDGPGAERVGALAADPSLRWSVVVLGALEHAGRRLIADSSGYLDTGLLSEPVRLPRRADRLAPA